VPLDWSIYHDLCQFADRWPPASLQYGESAYCRLWHGLCFSNTNYRRKHCSKPPLSCNHFVVLKKQVYLQFF
jgi:hypothetical protein